LFAAFTIEVVASVVIEVRMSEILELRDDDGFGRGVSVESDKTGWSFPFL